MHSAALLTVSSLPGVINLPAIRRPLLQQDRTVVPDSHPLLQQDQTLVPDSHPLLQQDQILVPDSHPLLQQDRTVVPDSHPLLQQDQILVPDSRPLLQQGRTAPAVRRPTYLRLIRQAMAAGMPSRTDSSESMVSWSTASPLPPIGSSKLAPTPPPTTSNPSFPASTPSVLLQVHLAERSLKGKTSKAALRPMTSTI